MKKNNKTQTVPAPVQSIVHSSQNPESTVQRVYQFVESAFLVIVIVLSVAYGKGLFAVASVNGSLISRFNIVQSLEKKYGKAAVDKVVTQELIKQELKKRNLNITDAQIYKELSNIEKNVGKQGKDLMQLLSAQGLTKEDLKDQIRTQLQVEQLFKDQSKVSQKEIDEFVEKNKENVPSGVSKSEINAQAKDQLVRAKLDPLFQTWVEQIKKNAKVEYFVQY